MARRKLAMLIIALSLPWAGCAICQSPDDANFAYFGGITTRNSAAHGRVGSVFDDGSGYVEGEYASEDVGEGEEYYEYEDGELEQ